jgi:hypothetical protein
MQIENRLVAAAEDMHVRRNVIGRVYDDAISVESQDGRHPAA